MRIEQYDDRVLLSYEEYGGVREIYLDGRGTAQPGDEHVKLGRSAARYEGDRLIIESTHILAGPTGTEGNQLTDQVTTVETYRRLDDTTQGPMVEMEMIINDPAHLYEPWGDGLEEALPGELRVHRGGVSHAVRRLDRQMFSPRPAPTFRIGEINES